MYRETSAAFVAMSIKSKFILTEANFVHTCMLSFFTASQGDKNWNTTNSTSTVQNDFNPLATRCLRIGHCVQFSNCPLFTEVSFCLSQLCDDSKYFVADL